jgi:hypothetical protein
MARLSNFSITFDVEPIVLALALLCAVLTPHASAAASEPQLWLRSICNAPEGTVIVFTVDGWTPSAGQLTDYGRVHLEGMAGDAHSYGAWPYTWLAQFAPLSGQLDYVKVVYPPAAFASIEAARLTLTPATGAPLTLRLANPQLAVRNLEPCAEPEPPAYHYSNCDNSMLRVYDGADGQVRWGQPTAAGAPTPTPGDWTDNPLPLVGRARLLSLTGCRIAVRDNEGLLWLDYLGSNAWSLPAVGYATYLPLLQMEVAVRNGEQP